jgi:hypothetical protein
MGAGISSGVSLTGVAKHQALVTRTGIQVVVRRVVDALGDVVGLLVVAHHDRAALVIDAVLGVVVADALDGVTRHLDVVHMCVGGDLTSQHHQTGVGQGFGRNAAAWVLFEDGIQNGVRDLVSHFVGVTFRDGFGCKEIVVRHKNAPVLV